MVEKAEKNDWGNFLQKGGLLGEDGRPLLYGRAVELVLKQNGLSIEELGKVVGFVYETNGSRITTDACSLAKKLDIKPSVDINGNILTPLQKLGTYFGLAHYVAEPT